MCMYIVIGRAAGPVAVTEKERASKRAGRSIPIWAHEELRRLKIDLEQEASPATDLPPTIYLPYQPTDYLF